MLLTICVPSLPERHARLGELLASIPNHPEIELLVLMDNRTRPLGAKRNTLAAMAAGEYFCHVDDDDLLLPGFAEAVLPALRLGCDLVHYDSMASLDDSEPFRVRTVVGAANEQPKCLGPGRYSDITRTPWSWCCWKKSVFSDCRFPEHFDAAEDAFFLRQALPLVRTATRIDSPLHRYRWGRAWTTFPA